MSEHDQTTDPELRRMQEVLRALAPVEADPAFKARLRQRFVSGAIDEGTARAEQRRPRLGRLLWWISLPAMAAATTAVLLTVLAGPSWELHDTAGEGTVVDGQQLSASKTTRLAGLIRPGARIQVSEGTSVDLIAEDVLLLQLTEQGDATLPSNPRAGEDMAIRLEAGELRVRTGPGFVQHRLSIATSEGRIAITGTIISVYKGDVFTCVCVLEGTGRIGKSEATMENVSAGRRKVMFADERPSLVTDIEPHHKQGLDQFVETTRGVFD